MSTVNARFNVLAYRDQASQIKGIATCSMGQDTGSGPEGVQVSTTLRLSFLEIRLRHDLCKYND